MQLIRKIKRRLLVILLVVGLSLHVNAVDAMAGEASQKSKTLAAYNEMLERRGMFWAGSSDKVIELNKCEFLLAYVDDDNIPELVLSSGDNDNGHADGYFCLYTYRKGKVQLVANLMDGFSYYEKTGVFCGIHTGTGGGETYYGKLLSNGKYKYFLYSQDEGGYDIDGDGRSGIDYYKVKNATNTWIETSKELITKKEFNNKLKALVGKKKSKPSSSRAFHANTLSNRKKYLNAGKNKDKYDKYGRVVSDYSGRISKLVKNYSLYEASLQSGELYELRFLDNGIVKSYSIDRNGNLIPYSPSTLTYKVNDKKNTLTIVDSYEKRVYTYDKKKHILLTKYYTGTDGPGVTVKWRYCLVPYNKHPNEEHFYYFGG